MMVRSRPISDIRTHATPTLSSRKCFQLCKVGDVMVNGCCWAPFQKLDQAWFMDFIDFPNEFKQMPGYAGVIATFNVANSLPAPGNQNLTLGSKPEMHPDRKVDKYDRIRRSKTALNAWP